MSADNPKVEPEDQFYTKSETPELLKTADEDDVTKAEEQSPNQEDEKIDKPDELEAKVDDDSEELNADDEEEETQYIELDGTETSLDEVRKWRDEGLMQSDYTKKTTEHSQFAKKEREELAFDRENLTKANDEVSDMRDQLTVLVAEDETIDWAELKDSDPEEYINLKEKADKRKAALEKVKADRNTPADDPALIESERGLLFAANPEWLDKENKTTETFKKDTALMNTYVSKAGFSSEEFSSMTSSRQLTTILKAAKYDELQEKGRKIKEKRDKVPVVTKPKANIKTQPTSMADTFYGDEAG